ncbi:hypothetical protein N7468_002032 [Penicillium chermesinum]|uniref:Thioesterase-like superfamily-domain-containing protein n=1 Tax=Penicillium chermesinum TaxID=63820 RepID=A0A9W9PHZ6_9EURO|nr:uncharacterized protein N7468_002032 [Penicillium chermesinum]KAJ5247049.1 hypothetical protein N7468_002032 [Penicillium chermesinum]
MVPPLNVAFEEATRITPQGDNQYTVDLKTEWCIGTVPHGGYTTAVLYKTAIKHFEYAHPKQYDSPASPISIQLAFLRRTLAGPATILVEDVKIGLRTSTIHIKLLQGSEKKKGEQEVKISGYITVSPPSAEVGLSAPSGWELTPAAPPGTLANGGVNFEALGRTGRDGLWTRTLPPFPEFRRAATHLEVYRPVKVEAGQGLPQSVIEQSNKFEEERGEKLIGDQWARFRPGQDEKGRWTDAAVVYLTDMFPMMLDGLDRASKSAMAKAEKTSEEGIKASFWYPTVTLNIDMKKHLPAEGVEWLFSRVVITSVRNGRTDLNVIILDEKGEVVAISTQVGLVVSASRNLGSRKMQKL